jgi:hypothetical protein
MPSNINLSYPILCVTYTIMNKCRHTLFSSVLCTILYLWVYSHELFKTLFMSMPSPRLLSLHCNLGGSIFSNHLTIPIQYLPSFVHVYWTIQNCKRANWVLQAFLRSNLVPKCDTCYLKNKCYYTYSNSKLVTLSYTYVIYFTWAILKFSHTLILPRPNYLPNHTDLSQLSSSIHISQIMIYYHILLIITS